MTVEILLAIAVGAALILNAMQAAKAAERRTVIKDLRYQIELLTRPVDDGEAVYLRDPQTPDPTMDDWLRDHPGVTPKPGYERKRR